MVRETYVKTGRISKNWTWSAFHFSKWAPNSGRKNMLGNMLFNYTPKEMELVFAVPWSSSKMNSLVHCNNTYGSMNFPKMNSQLTITITYAVYEVQKNWTRWKTELIIHHNNNYCTMKFIKINELHSSSYQYPLITWWALLKMLEQMKTT
jgi:hypothetical protein